MFGAILKATNSSFQKGMAFCRSIYVKKVMKLLAFIFEQPSHPTERQLKKQIPWVLKVKKGKDQESIQSSTTPDPGFQWKSDNFTIIHHNREPRGQPHFGLGLVYKG